MRQALDDFSKILSGCRITGETRLLYDYRTREGHGSAVENIIFGEEIPKLHDQHLDLSGAPMRIAFLGSHRVIDSYDSGLDTVKSREFSAIVTLDPWVATAFLVASEEVSGVLLCSHSKISHHHTVNKI